MSKDWSDIIRLFTVMIGTIIVLLLSMGVVIWFATKFLGGY